jgi:FMN-dependent NADH-azoreductase
MSNNILVIDSSAARDGSVSRVLVDHAVDLLRRASPGAEIVRRDLGVTPVPHLTPETLAGIVGAPATEPERAARELSDALIREVKAADVIVVGAPMYNFGVSTLLRSWFDHVLRAGETFGYSDAGPQGLLRGKRAVVVEARGGLYSEGPAKMMDFQEPYLRHLFAFVGITDVTFVRAEKIGFGPEAREQAIASARALLTEHLSREVRAAA